MTSSAATDARQGRCAELRAGACTRTSDQWLDVIEEAQRDMDAAAARQAIALAHLSAIEPTLQEDGTSIEVHHGLGHQCFDAPELAAPRMGVSTMVAATRMRDAVRQEAHTPDLVDAMAAGELDQRRAGVVTDETDFLDPEQAAAVVAHLRPMWRGVTQGPLRKLVARVAAQLFPEAVAAEADQLRQRRFLIKINGEHGIDTWHAELPAERSATAWAAVTEVARQLVRESDSGYESIAQARADALTQLILEHSDVRVVVHATRAAEDSDQHSGKDTVDAKGWLEVGGLGRAGPTLVPASLLAAALGVSAELVCHPETGALIGGDVPAGLAAGRDITGRDITGRSTETSPNYRIPAAMARFVRLRDGCCRFPGCTIPARQCDLDHVRPWPTGPTDPSNLACLCRRHHRIKQREGWFPRLHSDGTMTWRDPSGRTQTTRAVDHLRLASIGGSSTSHRAGAGVTRRLKAIDISLFEEQLDERIIAHRRDHPERPQPCDMFGEPLVVSQPSDLDSSPWPVDMSHELAQRQVDLDPPPF